MANDINSVVPSVFNVRFPYLDTTVGPIDYYLSKVQLNTIQPNLFVQDLLGNGWEWIVHDSYPAQYNSKSNDPQQPNNQGDLDAIAAQIATDYINWRLFNYDIVYNGICNISPTGYDWIIEWKYTGDDATTRTIGNPMNGEPEEYQHSASPSGCGEPAISGYAVLGSSIPAGQTVMATINLGGGVTATVSIFNPYPVTMPSGVTVTLVRYNCAWMVVGANCPTS